MTEMVNQAPSKGFV